MHIANTYYGKRTVLDYLHIIFWFVLIEFIGLISLPLAGMLAEGLADRAYSASRTLGIMLLTYMSWIFSYLLGFNKVTVFISLLVLCLISLFVYKKKRYFPDKKILLLNEFIFVAAFLFFLIVRIHIPRIYMHEKFMDFAFLNALIRTSSFPPADPWFSGRLPRFLLLFGIPLSGHTWKTLFCRTFHTFQSVDSTRFRPLLQPFFRYRIQSHQWKDKIRVNNLSISNSAWKYPGLY